MFIIDLLSSLFLLRYQWILLKNISAGEYSDDESHESMKKEATELVNKIESQSGSGHRRRVVNGVEEIRIVARISQVLHPR